ncbi:Chromosome partitioning protein ParB [Paraburkholderia tropica]|uniref:ParB/RepB/Spo0J family partition protein n=1 Tax=Paraburkholderia tropica TaxID=92647 RepID=UPI001CB440A1|nr:chromosome partitioning protein ParB [Paraburkholderia tropica]CAG9235742.1 Chromosome partitioning protein ParB [Paraburkholderia tropica]
MNLAKRLSERTKAIESDPARVATATKVAESRTSPGRIFDAQNLVNQAEEKLEGAERELAAARTRIEELERAGAAGGASEVDIATLVEVPGRRRVLSQAEYQELRENLANNPLIHPIVYRPLGDGRNEIVSGANRTAIYRDDLKRSKILGIAFNGDAKEAELGATFSNLLAPSLPDFEKFRQFRRLQDESGFTRNDIIKASGLSSSHIHRILAFEKLPSEALAAITTRPDSVGGHAAEEFAALANAGNGDAVVKAIRALVEDETLTQKEALSMAKPKLPKPEAAPTRTISIGRKKLCEVAVRNGVVGVRFAGNDSSATAQEWADKIEAFIKREIDSSAE